MAKKDSKNLPELNLNKRERVFQIFKLMDILERMRVGPGTYDAYDTDEVLQHDKNGTVIVKKKRKIWSKDDACLVNYTTSLKTTEARAR